MQGSPAWVTHIEEHPVNRNVALPALFIVIAVSACSGGGSLTPNAPGAVTQSQTSERAPASYGGIPDIIRLPVTLTTACPSPTPSPAPSDSPSPAPSDSATLDSRRPSSYGGIPDVLRGIVTSVTDGCGS
jgi:hypothetical protein